MKKWVCTMLILFFSATVLAQANEDFVKKNYLKTDTTIRMRDGIKLYTIIYTPKDDSARYPILMQRTPYSAGPYGDTNYARRIGPNPTLMKEKYIFVYQDVRGRYMSEGLNKEMTPHIPKKNSAKDTDESSDTYDTIEWLLANVKNNNGRVGIYGISYPGFYATAALPDAHPAIKAVSPQAPVTDEFAGDDAYHNGAFFLLDNFSFINYFGKPRTGPVQDYGNLIFPYNAKDAYDFFLRMGPLSNTQSYQYFDHKSYIWNEYLEHDSYDDYWKARNISNHLDNVKPATLVVGGWFDAENIYGALKTYHTIEKRNPGNRNSLVMGPWTHGVWAAPEWKHFASHDFGSNTSKFFQDTIETNFFNYYLKDKGTLDLPEAMIFETGSNQWKSYKSWPPENIVPTAFYPGKNQSLFLDNNKPAEGFDEYISDPRKPVPYTSGIYGMRNNDYMAEDQRFAAYRPDVLVYETPPLAADVTVTGSILADLQVSVSGSDADFIVKVIDVLPATEPNFKNAPKGFQMAGYQRLVRAEVLRGKFRNGLDKPLPFKPDEITEVKFSLNEVAHTFRKGHKIMIQVQSSWFPLVDRNPQQFLRISEAKESDFRKATIRLYYEKEHQSKIIFPILNKQ